MSRIGKQPIAIPPKVKVRVADGVVYVEGEKTKLQMQHHPTMKVTVDEAKKVVLVNRPDDERLSRSLHGLTRNLIANMVEGVTKGFEKKLKVVGVGFQARMDKNVLELRVGFANPIRMTPPEGITVAVAEDQDKQPLITIKGADKQKVGQFAAEVRAARKPEPYKGKGVRYIDENVRRKEGKSFSSK